MSDGGTVRAVIQCAMDLEAVPFLDALEPGSTTRIIGAQGRHQQSFTTGRLDWSTVLVVTAGIGLANAASATARALEQVDPDVVVAAGTTGGLGVDVVVGDVIAGTSATYSSADARAFGYARGQIPQMPADYHCGQGTAQRAVALSSHLGATVRVGQVVSSDSFVTSANVGTTREEFPRALATDMETAALAQVSWSVGVDWISLRAVSDLCGPRADQDFHMDSTRAARISMTAVRAFLSL